MARPARPWYWIARGVWMVTIAGVRHNLGPEKGLALKAYHTLMAGNRPPAALSAAGPGLTFAQLVERFQAYRRGRVSPDTHAVTDCYLRALVAVLGDRPVPSLTGPDLAGTVDGHAAWGPTTRNVVITRLRTLYRWAVKMGLAPNDVTADLTKPTVRVRGSEIVLAPDAVARLLAAAPEALGSILVCLYDTGARPGEVIRVTAGDFRPAEKVWVLARHKTVRHTGRPRVIHLTDRVVELCLARTSRYPTGPLFRSPRGLPYKAAANVDKAFRALRAKLGLGTEVVPYSLRHGFVTEALGNGVPDTLVAALVGHTGTRLIHQVYSHVGEQSRVLKEALVRIRPE